MLKTRRRLAALAAAGLLIAGCGGSEPGVRAAEALREVLLALDADSTTTLSTGDTVRISSHAASFYAARGHAAAWVGDKELLDRGRALHAAIGRAGEDGLEPERYRHDVAAALLAAVEVRDRDQRLSDSAAVRHLAELDLLLTEGFSRYARDLVTGTLDPAEAGLDWRIATEVPHDQAVLTQAFEGRDPLEIVAHLRPSIPYYERMRTALAQYHRAAAAGGWPQLPDGETLKPGERSAVVAALRQRFVGGADPREAELAASGAADATLFDAGLAEAVQHFQNRHAIEADGAVGAATLRELNHTVEERIAELKMNLDRWRWLPNHLGERFVLVNVAGFELEVVDSGRAVETMNVVVGRLDRQTPIFADSIQHVVVNPYWNVPDGIYSQDVLPALERDPYYLVKNNMEEVDGRIRQKPGPTNALGRYKFIFPNEFDVYLHDTPEGHLFSRTSRDFSSGCIRLERPDDFARLLLDMQTDRGSGQLDALLTNWNERWVKLDRPLPVYILYFTAWVEQDGTVRFHHDVYGRDEKLDSQVEELEAAGSASRVAATGG
jgi:L,D-transpeptidase YcbB